MCIKRKSTNCSTRKAFLEKAVVELVYTRSPTANVELITKVRLKKHWSTNIILNLSDTDPQDAALNEAAFKRHFVN